MARMPGKPTAERLREQRGGQAYGLVLFAAHKLEQAKEEEERRRQGLPSVRREQWKRPENSDCPYDFIEVDVRRSAQGKFAKAPTVADLAKRFKMKTGRETPPPKNPKKRPQE